jgi:hypothetical protein
MLLDHLYTTQTLDLTGWEQYRTTDTVYHDDTVLLPHVTGAFYRKSVAGRIETCGVFSHRGVPAYVAWGYEDEEHCGAYVVLPPTGGISAPIPGCPQRGIIYKDTRVVGFSMAVEGVVYTWQ